MFINLTGRILEGPEIFLKLPLLVLVASSPSAAGSGDSSGPTSLLFQVKISLPRELEMTLHSVRHGSYLSKYVKLNLYS